MTVIQTEPSSPAHGDLTKKLERINRLIESDGFLLQLLEDHPSAPSISSLVERQKQAIKRSIDKKHQIRQRLIDQLEAPQLRSQLIDQTQKLEIAQQTLSRLERELTTVQTENQDLLSRLQTLESLYQSMNQQITQLSLHEYQNKENHSFVISYISEALRDLGIGDVIARPSRARLYLNDANTHPELDEAEEDPYTDQTIFSKTIRRKGWKLILSIVVSACTDNIDQHPIEVIEIIYEADLPYRKKEIASFPMAEVHEAPKLFHALIEHHLNLLDRSHH